MTISEAIEVLKDFDKQVSVKSCGAYQTTIGKMACDMAISALEKQIPKKPNRTTDELEIRYTDSYRCPNCNKGFSGTGIANFCYHCGQRLDWSDTD